MASNILSIGQSALTAAQVGISVTGHNIANASTAGYSRQVLTQSAAQAQNFGYGYVGQGTSVSGISRVYNELLNKQLTNSQSVSSSIDTYSQEITTIDNMLSDASAGINPAMNDFFSSVKKLSANASDTPTRQSMLSSAQSLVNRFNTMGNRLNEIAADVNTQVAGSVTSVNAYATQIARLNDVIDKAISTDGNPPNDLMDQRDQLVNELSKQIKTTIVPQGQGSYNVFVGNGLPLVVGKDTFSLTTMSNPTDASRLEVGYFSNGNTTMLGQTSLPGGALGGLIQFRNETLDTSKNQLGQIAVVLSETFNNQHKLGFDKNGTAGTDLFNIPSPVTTANSSNTGSGVVSSTFNDATAIRASDYSLKFDGTNYSITRLSDNTTQSYASLPQTFDGLNFQLSSGTIASGDEFVIRPTQNAAASFKLVISDLNKLAIAGSATTGASDNTNGLALAGLQIQSTVQGAGSSSKISFSSAFGQLVSGVGNKAHELNVTGISEKQVLSSAIAARESESGVNLDEEATNLIRYQQAYQAAGKMMQIATDLFNVLLQLGQ